MIAALRCVSLRHFLAHKLRTTFTVVGIALGVAAIISMRLMHESVAQSYEQTVERIAGSAVLQVTNGQVGVPEELAAALKEVPGIGAVAPSVQGQMGLPDLQGERLYLFGVDMLADQELREYRFSGTESGIEDPLVFLAQADSVALTTTFLEAHHLAIDDRIAVLTPTGATTLTVRGALAPARGPAGLFGGRLAVMDVTAAQRLFGLDRRYNQIDVGVAAGGDVAVLEAAVKRVVGAAGLVERPRERGETLERLLASNRFAFTLSALIAVIAGMYLIFNAMMIAVVQRRREIAILRALGMRRGEMMRLIVAEAVVVATIGCILGIPLGHFLARAMVGAFAANISSTYVAVETPDVPLRLAPVCWGVGLGLLSAVVAAAVPARQAIQVHPLEVLRPSGVAGGEPSSYLRALVVGVLVTSAAVGLWVARGRLPLAESAIGSVSGIGLLVGMSLVVPAAVRTFARRSERLLEHLLGPVGSLASQSIVRHIGRVAITCSAFVVSLAGAIMIATFLSSIQHTLTLWVESLFGGIDLIVASGTGPLSREGMALPGSLADEIASLPQVAHVDAVRIVRVAYEGSLPQIVATETALFQRGIRQINLLAGDRTAALNGLARGEAVVVNEAFVRRFDKHPGDVVVLASPTGEVRLPIAGVYFDFGDPGTILMDRAVYRQRWRDDTLSFIDPVLRPGASAADATAEIQRRWGARYALFIMTTAAFRDEVDALLGRALSFSYPLIALALAIALLGIVNSLLASVLDRIREIGLLRAVGATRGQVTRSIMIEAGIVGMMGGVLAVLVGSVLGYAELEVILRGMFGMTIFYRYPLGAAAFALAAGVLLAIAAGYLPGRSAGRLRVTDALTYE